MGGVLRKVAMTSIILLLLTGFFLLALSVIPFEKSTGAATQPGQPAAKLHEAAIPDGNEKNPNEPRAITLKAKVSDSLIPELNQKESVNVIVQLKSDASRENARKKRYELSKKLYEEQIEASEEDIGNIITTRITKDSLAILSSDQSVESVEPDRIFYASLEESLTAIGAPSAWESSYTGEGVLVAILDTGVNGSEVQLSKDFSESGHTFDGNGHGTVIATAMMAAAPKAQLVSAKVLDDSGKGLESSIISGINWAAQNNAAIIVLSLGGPYSDTDSPLNRAIKEASERGIAVITAAGNCGKEEPSPACGGYVGVTTPGNSPYAITAGAVDKQNSHASFSSGEDINGVIKPDVAAPGVGVIIDGREYSGTSVSAAITAGAAALVKQAVPELTPEQLKTVIEATSTDLGDEGKDTKFGSGLVNLTTAVSKLKEASDLLDGSQQEQPEDKKVIDIGVVDLDLIALEPLSPEAAMLEPTESSIKITHPDRKGIVGILLNIISGKKPSYEIGKKVTLELEETTGYSQSGGKAQVYDYCELIVYPHYKKVSDSPGHHKIRDNIEAGSGPWKITLTFTVLSEYAGPGEFQAWVWCSGNKGSPQYSWRGSTAKFEWEGVQPSSCTPHDPSISILWVQGTQSSVDYEAKVYNDLCEDYDAAYTPHVDSKGYPSVLLTPTIAPKGSRSNTGSVKDAFSEGSHTFKACLNPGGDCDEESFAISAACTDNIGTVDACLNNPVGSRCDGTAECQTPYCVHNFCRAEPYFCPDGFCDALEDSKFCPKDCGNITCYSNNGCGTDGYTDNNHCDTDENVHRTYRTYTCQNPGTTQSSCKHSDNDKIIKICGIGCSNGACKENIACKSEKDCKNTGWSGTPTCTGSSVYQNYLTAKCINPGQAASSCEYTSTPTLKEACKEGCEEGSCTSNVPFTVQFESSRGNSLNKQPGDFITFHINSAGKQKISFTYPDELTPVEGALSDGKASVEKGQNKLKFYIPETSESGDYTFSSGKTSFTAKIINEPAAIIITDSKALKDEFPEIGDGTKAADVLARAHELAKEKTGVVYDLAEEQLGERPWKSFDDYDEKLDKPKITDNTYSTRVADFIKSKCSACSILILGDDFVVPFYRHAVPDEKGMLWWKEVETTNIYTDAPYIKVTVPTFASLDSNFYFQSDPVVIVRPSFMSNDDPDIEQLKEALVTTYHSFTVPYNEECNQHSTLPFIDGRRKELAYCKDKCIQPRGCPKGNYNLNKTENIKVYGPDEVGCDSFGKMDGAAIILIGDKDTNSAIRCLPWVTDSEYPVLSLQRNVWDGGKGAVIIATNEAGKSYTMTTFTKIVQHGGIYDYVQDAQEMTLAELALDVGEMGIEFVPGKACVDAFDYDGGLSFRIVSRGDLLLCPFDFLMIGKVAKAPKAAAAAAAGIDSVKIAKETSRLAKLAKKAGYAKEAARVIGKKPVTLPYVSALAEKTGGAAGRAGFDAFFEKNLPEIAAMPAKDLPDFTRGMEALSKPPFVDFTAYSVLRIKEIGKALTEVTLLHGEAIAEETLAFIKKYPKLEWNLKSIKGVGWVRKLKKEGIEIDIASMTKYPDKAATMFDKQFAESLIKIHNDFKIDKVYLKSIVVDNRDVPNTYFAHYDVNGRIISMLDNPEVLKSLPHEYSHAKITEILKGDDLVKYVDAADPLVKHGAIEAVEEYEELLADVVALRLSKSYKGHELYLKGRLSSIVDNGKVDFTDRFDILAAEKIRANRLKELKIESLIDEFVATKPEKFQKQFADLVQEYEQYLELEKYERVIYSERINELMHKAYEFNKRWS